MDPRIVVLVAVLTLNAVLSSDADASIVGSASVHTCYFEVLRDFNAQDPEFYEPTVVGYWKSWLQAYRTIARNPRLSHKFARHKCDLTNRWLYLPDELQRLGLTESQIRRQPAFAYTLDIATFANRRMLVRYLNSTWVRHRVGQHKIYERVPKGFRFEVSYEGTTKVDPLYLDTVRVGRHQRTWLRYGIYESVSDADRDRHRLRHYLKGRIRIIKRTVTGHLLEAAWFDALLGGQFQKWDVTTAT